MALTRSEPGPRPAARPTTSASPPSRASSTRGATGLERRAPAPPRAAGARSRRRHARRPSCSARALAAPLVVSAMTGGTAAAEELNRRLARAAAEHGIALVLGSGRALLDDPGAAAAPTAPRARGARRCCSPTSAPRRCAGPTAPERAERLVELLGADGLSIHLNPVQEAVQPEGEPDFAGVLDGHRRRRRAARAAARRGQGGRLRARLRGRRRCSRGAGVAAVDVAGAGGTNWALIEGRRDPRAGARGRAPSPTGAAPTADALRRRARRGARAAGDRLRRRARRRRRRRSASRSARAPSASRGRSCVAARADRAGEARRARCSRSCGSPPGRRAPRAPAALGREHLQ